MEFLRKVLYLLTPAQKRALLILTFLLLVGMLFEMLGLGVLLPALSLMLNSDIGKEYPSLKPYLAALGNPSHTTLVLWGMGILVVLYFLKAVFLVYLTWKQSRFTSHLSADLSHKLFLGYLRMPYPFHLQRNSAQLLRNIQGEISLFTSLSQSIINLSTELSIVVSVAFMLILVEPVGALSITFFMALFGYVFLKLTRKKLFTWGEQRQFHAGKTGQYLLQGFGGVKEVKLMGREDNFLSEYSQHNRANAHILTRVTTLAAVPRLYLELLAVVGMAGLIVLMVLQNKPVDHVVPAIGLFFAAAFRMIPSVNRILGYVQSVTYSKPVVNVLYDEFKLIEGSELSQGNVGMELVFNEVISLNQVHFSYDGATTEALNNISINIKKGTSIGLIGESGSGKSTLVDMILGLLTPSGGKILVDGADVHQRLRAWQDQVGYVPQTIYLIDDTLRRNIAFGIPANEINEEAVQRAIRYAQLESFVENLPEGLETMVGERGVRLSGGQRQRIGIARALYHNPEVLVLDEATSALDTLTEQGVMEALNAMHGKKTLIIVAHRLSTVEKCDWLYRLKKGKIVEEGIPAELTRIKHNIN